MGKSPATGRALALFAAFALSVALLAFAAQPAAASPDVLRESYAPTSWDTSFANVYGNQKDAQSFLARTDFLLTHLELYVFDQPGPEPDILQVFIAADAGNQPGTVLGSTAQQGVQNWTWVAFGFYPWISLQAGQRYWIIAADSQSRPKAYEWAMNLPGGYASGEAQWFDSSTGRWVNNTGADLFFRTYGISGPSLALEMGPTLLPVDPGAVVPVGVYFNNSGNDAASTARIEVRLDSGLAYQGDDASLEGGVQVSPLAWAFNGVSVGTHRMTVWIRVEDNRTYYDGESMLARGYLNYTDSTGQSQPTSSSVASVTVIVPVIRGRAVPGPAHVAPGQMFNFTVSFFNAGSGRARYLWINATAGAELTAVGDDAASAGGVSLGPLSWRFDNVSAQTYVFNVTVRADPLALPGDPLPFRLDIAYTDGAGHGFGSLEVMSEATIHGPSLVVAAEPDDPTPRPGDAFHVVLYLNNTGDENASWAWVNATLPAWTILEDSQPIAGTNAGAALSYVLRNVAPAPFAITLRLRVNASTPPAAPVNVSATLDVENASGAKLRPSSAVAIATIVTPRFSLVLGSTATSVTAGDTLDLTLGWNNTGNEAASVVWLNFTLPAKTLLANASIPWAATNGTTYVWRFNNVAPGILQFGVRLEVSSRLASGDTLVARLSLQFERADGAVFTLPSKSMPFSTTANPPAGLEILLLWVAILVALFLLFLLLSYLDVLPRRRSTIDDVFLLHNSGILICHYSTTLRPDVDSDIASGMLMAVRNFVADALRSKNGALEELRYGDYHIRMAHGRFSILVVFTRGHHTKGLEQRMAEVLRNIETAYEGVLESWSGRTEEFKGVEEHLLRIVNA